MKYEIQKVKLQIWNFFKLKTFLNTFWNYLKVNFQIFCFFWCFLMNYIESIEFDSGIDQIILTSYFQYLFAEKTAYEISASRLLVTYQHFWGIVSGALAFFYREQTIFRIFWRSSITIQKNSSRMIVRSW